MKTFFRILFSGTFVGLAVLVAFACLAYRHVGSFVPGYTFDLGSVVQIMATLVFVYLLGMVAGGECRGPRIRWLVAQMNASDRHVAYLRQVNATMIDDVLLAARNGLPVKSFPYGGQATQDEAERVERQADMQQAIRKTYGVEPEEHMRTLSRRS